MRLITILFLVLVSLSLFNCDSSNPSNDEILSFKLENVEESSQLQGPDPNVPPFPACNCCVTIISIDIDEPEDNCINAFNFGIDAIPGCASNCPFYSVALDCEETSIDPEDCYIQNEEIQIGDCIPFNCLVAPGGSSTFTFTSFNYNEDCTSICPNFIAPTGSITFQVICYQEYNDIEYPNCEYGLGGIGSISDIIIAPLVPLGNTGTSNIEIVPFSIDECCRISI